MNTLKYLLKPALLVLMGFGIAACEKEEGSQSVGQVTDSTINKAGAVVKDESHKLGVYMDDTAVTAKVNAAILAEPGMKVFDISVETINGVTTLTGNIDSDVNRNKAERLADGVEGVKRVENRLLIQSTM